ncbi:2OG-Fe dioxygenase family protein [Thiofilum flexile]|uniref:2OG-Fe dioxygenase family protein n=1 Tax=Thiofilum flexile TaxID=125627 RepID=UPI00035D08F7|nr:2OG-Fe dioxygenase family protein [Thiofilum flexile]
MKQLLQTSGYQLEIGANQPLQRQLVQFSANAYQRFVKSWRQLCIDPFLRDGGSYRLRRYSVFQWSGGRLTLLPHEPHYQSSHYNKVHGGFNRHFRPWLATTVSNVAFKRIVQWCIEQFGARALQQTWRIQAHQFRILAQAHEAGKPTPEGVHKDGADYILVMLLDRHNIVGGESQLFDNAMQPLEQATLSQRGDLLLINDAKVYHGVTEIEPQDNTVPAWRDVLVLTFHRQR